MKTIKIFLASSDELSSDRDAFGNLVRRLNDIYKKRGVEIELVRWEDLPAHYQGRRTQDMYNEIISDCNMFTAVFHKIAGKFTIEEFDVARENFDKKSFPKVYTYVKDLAKDESETIELTELKKKLYDELGHYWCRYGNKDTMQLHFVLQLHLLETESYIKLSVKDSKVLLDNHQVADLENIPFAACNDQYIDLKKRLESTQNEISTYESILSTADNETIEKLLLTKRYERQEIQEKLDEIEKVLLSTAVTIAKSHGKASSKRLKKATELFEKGDYKGVDAILDIEEIEADIRSCSNNLKAGKEIVKTAQDGYRNIIDEYKLKANNVLSNLDCDNRFEDANMYYCRIIELARECELPQSKYADLIFDYAFFAQQYNMLNISINLYLELIQVLQELPYSINKMLNIATSYNNLSVLYRGIKDFSDAESTNSKELQIYNELYLGVEDIKHAEAFASRGSLYMDMKRYNDAEADLLEGLRIRRKLSNVGDVGFAMNLHNIGLLYSRSERYLEAKKSYTEALEIFRNLLISESEVVMYQDGLISVLNGIGSLYEYGVSSTEEAEKAFNEALCVARKISNTNPRLYMPTVGKTLCHIGNLHLHLKHYNKAESIYFEALHIYKTIQIIEPEIGEPEIANILSNLGALYCHSNRYKEADKSYREALQIFQNLSTTGHGVYKENIASTYNNIGALYYATNCYKEAEEAFQKAVLGYKELAITSPKVYTSYVAGSLNNLGALYYSMNRNKKSEKFYLEALQIYTELLVNNPDTYRSFIADLFNDIGNLYQLKLKDYHNAELAYKSAIDFYMQLYKKLGSEYYNKLYCACDNLKMVYKATKQTDRLAEIERILISIYFDKSIKYTDK